MLIPDKKRFSELNHIHGLHIIQMSDLLDNRALK
jgi:hypothetical protein